MRNRAALVVVCAVAFVALRVAAELDPATRQSLYHGIRIGRAEYEPVDNFVGAALRVAGFAWIAIEWVAAVYLVRGYSLLRSWFRDSTP